MKLTSVELYWNSKNPRGAWKKDPSCLTNLNIENYYKLNPTLNLHKNHSILTGKKNNLTIVDIDCAKNEKITDNLFIKKFGTDPAVWAEKFGGLVVKTPSGGFHIYQGYDESIKHGQDAESNIDIRSEGGLIIAPGSVRDKKLYEVVAGSFEDMKSEFNPELRDFIHSIEYYDPTKKSAGKKAVLKPKKVKDGSGKEVVVFEVLGCDQSLYIYDYPDELLDNIIQNLPDKFFNTYDGYLLFATAMKQIDRQDIYDKYPKLNNPRGGDVDCEEHKIWLLTLYEGITGHKTILAFNHILKESKYDGARTTLDYYKYKPTLENKIKPDKHIHSEKLGYEFLDNIDPAEGKYIVVKSDTGTGKTTSFKHHYKKTGHKFISIVSRISLGLDQYETFNEFGIDARYYENENFEPDKRYIVQIDSLMKLKYFSDQGWIDDEYDLFMDEFNSIIKHLFTSETISKNGIRIPIMKLLVDLMRDARRVIMTDADISDQSLEFLNFVNIERKKTKIQFIKNDYKHNKGRPSKELFDYSEFVEQLKKEKKFICACDEARSCGLLKEELGDENILIIDAKTTKRYDWNLYDKIIFSPKVIYGIDTTIKRPVYCFYKETTIDPKDMLQQINRNRNITTLYYFFTRKKCKDCVYNTLKDAEDESNDLLKMCEKNDYLNQEFSSVHPIFKKIFNQFKYNNDSYSTNPYAHFKVLLQERGFKDITKIRLTNEGKLKAKLKEDKERQVNLIHKDIPFVKTMNEYIGLPEEEIENHKEIFLDKNYIHRYITARNYLFDKFGEEFDPENKKWDQSYEDDIERLNNHKSHMKNKLFENQEFNMKKIRTTKSQLIFLDRLKEALNIPDRLKIEGLSVMSEEKAKDFYDEYKLTFTDRSKSTDNPLLDYHSSQSLVNKIYKKIFGSTPFSVQETSKDGKSIRTYQDGELENMKYLYDVYEKTRKHYEEKKVKTFEFQEKQYEMMSDDED